MNWRCIFTSKILIRFFLIFQKNAVKISKSASWVVFIFQLINYDGKFANIVKLNQYSYYDFFFQWQLSHLIFYSHNIKFMRNYELKKFTLHSFFDVSTKHKYTAQNILSLLENHTFYSEFSSFFFTLHHPILNSFTHLLSILHWFFQANYWILLWDALGTFHFPCEMTNSLNGNNKSSSIKLNDWIM